jgi:hypothetical protein
MPNRLSGWGAEGRVSSEKEKAFTSLGVKVIEEGIARSIREILE